MKHTLPILLLWSASAWAQAPTAIEWVSPPTTLFTPFVAQDGWVVDLDGDGDDDLLSVTRAQGGLVFADLMAYRGAIQERVVLGQLDRLSRVAALDIDLDGDLDVVVGRDGRGTHLIRRIGPGLADWETSRVAQNRPWSDNRYKVVDVNGDGHPDLVIDDRPRTVLLASAGELQTRQLSQSSFDGPTRFADVDGDGDLDGVVDGTPAVLLRNDGAFPWAEVPLPLAGPIVGLADVAADSPGPELLGRAGHQLQIAPNRFGAGGTFGAWQPAAVEPMRDAAAVDVDGDGDLDLLGGAAELDAVALYLENRGDDGFARHQWSFFAQPARVPWGGDSLISDLDEDGTPELIDATLNADHYHFVVGRGVVTARGAASDEAGELEGGDGARHLVIEMERIAPYDGDLRLSGLELLFLIDDGEAAPLDQVFAHVDILVEASGNEQPDAGDVRVARLTDLQAITQVELAHPALGFRGDQTLRLYVESQLAPHAHVQGGSLRVGWLGASAAWEGGPVPVVEQARASALRPLHNEAPTADADLVTAAEGETTRLGVLANDADPQGDPLRVEVIEGPAFGALEIDPDGDVTYTHDGREAPLVDGFTYRVTDGRDASDVVAVIITIEPVNDPPTGEPDAYVTLEDTPLVIEADLGVLFNDADAEGPLLATLETPPQHGQLELMADGGFVYVPSPDYSGPDHFTYRPDDGDAQGEPLTVDINVLPVNDAPRPTAQAARTAPRTPFRLQLGEGDPEGGETWLLIESFPDHGHLVDLDAPAAAVTYVPPYGFEGAARFGFRLSDGRAVSSVFEATVQVGE